MEAVHVRKQEAKKSSWHPPTHTQARQHSNQSSCSGCGACRKITRSTNASASLMLKSLDPGKKVCATRFLQSTHGNQYVQRLISRPVQTKLTIGKSGDKYEQEADRVADTVMRMSEPQVQRQPEEEEEEIQMQAKPVAGQITPLVQKQPMEEEEEELQAKEVSGSTPDVTPNMETSLNALRGGGQPLPETNRNFMERRFGSDFSGVRVHTDSNAMQMSRGLNAEAFTYGNNIYFGAGRYSPRTSLGKRLLAHELTHVVQQGGAPLKGKAHTIQRVTDESLSYRYEAQQQNNRRPRPTGVYIAYVPLSVFPDWMPTGVIADHAFIESDDGWSAGFTMRRNESKTDARIISFEPRRNDPRKRRYMAERKNDPVSQSKTSAEIKQAIQTFARTDDPGSYNLITNNCGDWVKKAFNACYLKPRTPGHVY